MPSGFLREVPDTCGSVHKYRYIHLLMRLTAWHQLNPDISTAGLCLPDIYKTPAVPLSASGSRKKFYPLSRCPRFLWQETSFSAFCRLPMAGGEKSACFLRKFIIFFQAADFFFLLFDLPAQEGQFLGETHCRLWCVRA